MKELNVTTYRGYSQVNGSITLSQLHELICGNTYQTQINNIQQALAAGDNDRADRIKAQLPYLTATTNYHERRLPYSLEYYNDIATLDFDNMQLGQMEIFRRQAEADDATLLAYLSPRRHGLKILAYLTTPEAQALRDTFNKHTQPHTYTELESYHKAQYELARLHYEELLQTEADPSGSDLARGIFISHDPKAFFSPQRSAAVLPLQGSFALPSKEESLPRKIKKSTLPAPDESVNLNQMSQQARLDYDRALAYARKKYKFVESQRDNFVYTLANRCYFYGLPVQDTLLLVRHSFGNVAGFDAETPVQNAYSYTSHTDEVKKEKERPLVERLYDFLDHNYIFRRNEVLDTVEFRRLNTSESSENTPPAAFSILRTKDINSIYMHAQRNSLRCPQSMMKAAIDSDYAKDFNPFLDCFEKMKKWDGKTDHIARLASLVKTSDPDFWLDALRHWLVGMVACALEDSVQNQLFLLLYSKQGKGKSFFIRNLLPPPLRKYVRNGMIDFRNKDHALALSYNILINLEEFDGVSPEQLSELKHIIGQDNMQERKAFDAQAYNFVRRASFIGSTNNPHCLQDIGENRRFLFICIDSVDFKTPIDHEGIYSQALALYRNGYEYWYEGEEIDFLNRRNEEFRMKEPVEENLFYYYRKAREGEVSQKWLPASQMLSTICVYGRIQATHRNMQTLVTVLQQHRFLKRVTPEGITEYAIVEYSSDERSANAVKAITHEQKPDPKLAI